MIPRIITSDVERALGRQTAVALIGPRQVGKTTLALEIARSRDALYLDLEDRDDRNRLAEPALFLVILDEIHRTPELFQTLRGIIDLLADLLLLRRLQPFRANVGKRLVKSPKVYVRDSGLVHALLGLRSLEQLAGHPVVGESWEGYVIETLVSVLPPRATPYFYRTSAGAEIDLVIEHNDGTRWAIEIERSLSARVSRGFHLACADLKPARTFAVHAGDDRYPISEALEAISVRALAAELRARS